MQAVTSGQSLLIVDLHDVDILSMQAMTAGQSSLLVIFKVYYLTLKF